MKARFFLALVVSAGLLATSALSMAQSPPKPHLMKAQMGGQGGGRERMMKMREELYKKLHLTASQKKKIDAYDAHTERARAAERKAHPNDRAAMKPFMDKMRAEHEKFLKKTLTASQYGKYQAEMKAMRAKFGGGRGGPGAPRPGGPGGPPPGR